MIYDKHQALKSLKPTSEWTWGGFDYADLNWLGSDTKPTEAEIDAEVTRLENQYVTNEYQRNRAAEYPSVIDQLDKMFHSGFQAWKDEIQKVKDKYPKP